MKRYILAICLLAFSFQLNAHLLQGPKWEFIDKADKHRINAHTALQSANRMCVFIPDLDKREHMKAIIASGFLAAGVPNPRDKILSIGLTLIASLAGDVYDNYCSFRDLLTKAAYHLEMANFYDTLSLQITEGSKDMGSMCFMSAIDNLTLCEMLATSICDEDDRIMVCEIILNQRKSLIDQFKNPQGFLPANLYDEAYTFMENVSEMVADIQEDEIRDEICTYACSMVDEIEAACDHWGIDVGLSYY